MGKAIILSVCLPVFYLFAMCHLNSCMPAMIIMSRRNVVYYHANGREMVVFIMTGLSDVDLGRAFCCHSSMDVPV